MALAFCIIQYWLQLMELSQLQHYGQFSSPSLDMFSHGTDGYIVYIKVEPGAVNQGNQSIKKQEIYLSPALMRGKVSFGVVIMLLFGQ